MRWVLSLFFVLALGVTGCSEAEPVTDCSLVDEAVPCILDAGVGVCVDDGCFATDCSGVDDGTECASYSIGVGVCETIEGYAECVPGVSDCAGIPDGARCLNQGDLNSPGLCAGEVCHVDSEACAAVLEDPGTPCFMVVSIWEVELYPGLCTAEGCTFECEVLEEGAECRFEFGGPTGVCAEGVCVTREDCTGSEDGWPCIMGPDIGVCEAGACVTP